MSNNYENYGDWYDNGPGSESFKRKLYEEFAKIKPIPINVPGFPWYKEEKEKKDFLSDEDIKI